MDNAVKIEMNSPVKDGIDRTLCYTMNASPFLILILIMKNLIGAVPMVTMAQSAVNWRNTLEE